MGKTRYLRDVSTTRTEAVLPPYAWGRRKDRLFARIDVHVAIWYTGAMEREEEFCWFSFFITYAGSTRHFSSFHSTGNGLQSAHSQMAGSRPYGTREMGPAHPRLEIATKCGGHLVLV